MNYLRPSRLDPLAREYALGTLKGRARRRFERVLGQSPAADRAVAKWQERLAVLATDLPPMAPRDAVWNDLQQRLFEPATRTSKRASTAAARAPTRSWWQRLAPAHLLAGALGGLLIGNVVLRTQPQLAGLERSTETLPASYVGLLNDAGGKPTLLASSRRHGRVLTLKLLRPITVPAGQVAQLWAYPKDGGPPFAVGLVPAKGAASLPLPDSSEKLFFNVNRLAISLEAAPAAPGAAPSGNFIASGACVKLW